MAGYRLRQSGEEVQGILDNAAMRAQLTAETERAQSAEQQLQTNIDNEAQARHQADTTLDGKIAAEKTRAEGAEGSLQTAINNEAQARQQADGVLDGKIAAEKTRAEGAEGSLQTAINNEAKARQLADGVLDVSELNATENPHTLAKYVDLSSAISAIQTDYQKGGMSIKFVQSSDNKYVQYRLMLSTFTAGEFAIVSNWQGVDVESVAGSRNLVESGGAYKLKTDKIGIYQHELAINGSIQPLELFEIGNISFDNDGPTYSYKNTRARTKIGSSIYLFQGDIIYMSSGRFYIGYYDDNNVWHKVNWQSYRYIVPENGNYIILLEGVPAIVLSSSDELASLLTIKRNTAGSGINNNVDKLINNSVCSDEKYYIDDFSAEKYACINLDGSESENIALNRLVIPLNDKSVRITGKCGTSHKGYLAVAFYSSQTISSDSFIYGIPFVNNTSYLTFDALVPKDAVIAVVCNRTDSYTAPEIVLYSYLNAMDVKKNTSFIRLTSNDIESGNIKFNTATWIYNTQYDRTRLKQGKTVHLPAGVSISFTGARYYIGWRNSESIYGNSEWLQSGDVFTTTVDGEYVFLFDISFDYVNTVVWNFYVVYPNSLSEETFKTKVAVNAVNPVGSNTYYGRRIVLNQANQQYKCFIKKLYSVEYGSDGVNPLIEANSSTIYDNKIFVFLSQGTNSAGILAKVYSMTDYSLIADIPTLPELEDAHCNGAQFTSIFYDTNDTIPLLLLSSGSYSNNNWVKVVRIVESNGSYTVTVVKTINYDSNSIYHTYIGTSCIDERNNCLWFYAYKDGQYLEEGFYKFELPNLTDGVDVTLTGSDVLRYIKFPYRVGLQDSEIYAGKMYMCALNQGKFEGFPSTSPNRCVVVIDLESGTIENVIPGYDAAETEGISVYNKALFVTSRNGGTSHASTDEIFHITRYFFG